MLFEYKYFGATAVDSSAFATGMSFAPDTSRAPTHFRGKLAQNIAFRECISALHDVVASDLRFKPKDRSEYLAWLSKQEELDWAELAVQRGETRKQLDAAQRELNEIRGRRAANMRGFYAARQQYFNYLYRRDKDAWFVLDPVITVHPDEVFFECFSQDESSYGRVGCSYEVFREVGELACGTTNVDYSAALYNEFQKIRDYKDTVLEVDPKGFDVQTGGDEGYREVKIDLPDSWVRGFLQVSSAMTLPGVTFQLHPMDVHNFCFVLRRARERHGPRSMRFRLTPGQPVQVTFEPWGKVVVCPRSIYTGASEHEIRVWGRRRLHLMERLVPVARSFQVTLLGYGMPSFRLADCGDISFTLGLSGWTAADWSKQSNFDLLAPRGEVDSLTQQAVFDALGVDWRATAAELSARLGLDTATVRSALQAWTQAGRVMYDLNKGVFRKRELAREPLDLSRLRFSNDREQSAAQLVADRQVSHRHVRVDGEGNEHVAGRVGRNTARLVLDRDRRLTAGECDCSFHFRNKLRKGPCEHLLALRLAHDRDIGEVSDTPPTPPPAPSAAPRPQHRSPAEPEPEPPPRPVGFTPRVIRRATNLDSEGARLLGLLRERRSIALDHRYRDSFVAQLDTVLATWPAGGAARVTEVWRLFMQHPGCADVFIDVDELASLLEEWG